MASGPSRKKPASSASAAKSAKALKAAGSRSRGATSAKGSVVTKRQVPWITIGAVVVVLAFVAAIAVYLVPKYETRAEAQRFVPSADNPDPSSAIDGVTKVDYPAGQHVTATQRVAYDQSPPFGGPHDQVWATCTGTVYPNGLRTENAVHSLEHGAVWITWNPDTLPADQVSALESKVTGKPYMLGSAYPGQSSPVSLQSWGHRLEVDSANDPRIDEFITALRLNSNTYPEVGASCDTANTSLFDPADPPPFDPTPPGPDAVPMSGTGATQQDITDPSQLSGAATAPSTSAAATTPEAAPTTAPAAPTPTPGS
ncbi:DUF3105 domain-containing protein [Rhodococcus aerolatus]